MPAVRDPVQLLLSFTARVFGVLVMVQVDTLVTILVTYAFMQLPCDLPM
jgi:hypothetical protein